MSKYERAVAAVRKNDQIRNAIIEGLAKSDKMGYTKPYDKAVGIIVCLEEAGFQITRKPRVDGLTPGLKNVKANRMKW